MNNLILIGKLCIIKKKGQYMLVNIIRVRLSFSRLENNTTLKVTSVYEHVPEHIFFFFSL